MHSHIASAATNLDPTARDDGRRSKRERLVEHYRPLGIAAIAAAAAMTRKRRAATA